MDKRVPRKTLMKAAGGPEKILAFLDRMDGVEIEGWAVDAAAPAQPLKLRVLIDDVIVDVVTCNGPRDDVAGMNLPSSRVGFSYTIPNAFQDGSRHVLRFATIEGARVTMSTRTGMAMPEMHFRLVRQTQIVGVMDGMVDGLIQGWALRVDQRSKKKTGGVRILVTVGAQPIAELVADLFRADVAEAMGSDAANGFAFSAPPELRHGRRLVLSFYAMPERVELQGSPVEVTFAGDAERQRINALIGRADELFTYAYHLRRELKAALPGERFMLSDYVRWAAKALPGARDRAKAKYGDLPPAMPLVSVVCPVYRPKIGEFLTAIDSIRAQSYPNWELLLVDDGSRNEELTPPPPPPRRSSAWPGMSRGYGTSPGARMAASARRPTSRSHTRRASLSRFSTMTTSWSRMRWTSCCARGPQLAPG